MDRPWSRGAPSVLLLHGNGGCRTSCLGRAEILARAGCTVLLISLRAHGDSTGQRNDIGQSARQDVFAAVDFLDRSNPGTPIVIHGTSLGAAAAVFASHELGTRVQGYILESPYQDLKTAVRNRTENELPPILDWIAYRGLLAIAPAGLTRAREDFSARGDRRNPFQCARTDTGRSSRPQRPARGGAVVFNRVRSHAQLILFDRAGHMTFPETHPERYTKLIRDFINNIMQH